MSGVPQVEEKDWRGILAVGFTAAFAAIAIVALWIEGIEALQSVAAIFGSMEGLIIGFYFGQKSKG